jgi:small subunit ribosomal protein S8
MSVSDPIADMICVIKNGWRAKKEAVSFPYSQIKESIIKILVTEGFVQRLDVTQIGVKKTIKVTLKYTEQGTSVISEMLRESTPGRRLYTAKSDISKVKNGYGISIISTNKGVLSGKQARINKVGGETLCTLW